MRRLINAEHLKKRIAKDRASGEVAKLIANEMDYYLDTEPTAYLDDSAIVIISLFILAIIIFAIIIAIGAPG